MNQQRRASTLKRLEPYIERARVFSGWNFSELNVRPIHSEPPWDYAAIAAERMKPADRVLDVATGGGEVLERIVAQPRRGCVATERWHVNAPIARDRLRSLGVGVVRARSRSLPFRDDAFDLVLDRHEGIDPFEILRVLRGDGTFVTQQVWRRHWQEIREFFPRKTDWGDHMSEYAGAFRAAGWRVDVQEYDWKAAYGSLGDVVFMMLVTPWEVPDFDPVGEIDALIALEDALTTPDGIVLTLSRYLLIAEGPKVSALRRSARIGRCIGAPLAKRCREGVEDFRPAFAGTAGEVRPVGV